MTFAPWWDGPCCKGVSAHGSYAYAGRLLRLGGPSSPAGATGRTARRAATHRAPGSAEDHLVRPGRRLPVGGCPAGDGGVRPHGPPPPPAVGGTRHLGSAARRPAPAAP